MGVTRDDVARAAVVSTAVVSYVLDDGPRPVAAATRDRVLAAIRELGYRPDGVARHLRAGRTLSLGLVVPDPALPYYAEFTKHVDAAGEAAGRQILLASPHWDTDRERTLIAGLAERRVDGVVLLSADPLQAVATVSALGLPVVGVDRPEVAERGTAAVVAHLRADGHVRVGLLTGPRPLRVSDRRARGWTDSVAAAGLAVREEWVLHGAVSRQGFDVEAVEDAQKPRADVRAGGAAGGRVVAGEAEQVVAGLAGLPGADRRRPRGGRRPAPGPAVTRIGRVSPRRD